MALIVLASASGSPGVTTTALGLALVWHRPVVLVDADPVGGSALLAGYFQGTVADDDAMVNLVLAHRDGRLAEVLPRTMIPVPDTYVSSFPDPSPMRRRAACPSSGVPSRTSFARSSRRARTSSWTRVGSAWSTRHNP